MYFNKRILKNALILFWIITFTLLSEKEVYTTGFFQIERPGLGLELSYEFEKDIRTGPDTGRDDKTRTFSERVDIETRGWVYHPGLVTYTLRLSPEWEQILESYDGEDGTSRSFLEGYFTELTFLQLKPYTLRIFANRQMSTLRSALARRTKIESDTYGATFMLKYRMLPTILSYNHLKSTETGFYTTDKDRDDLRLNMRHDRGPGDTTLNASYMESTRITRGISVDTRSQKATLQNSYDLTKDKRVTLSSLIGYSDTLTDSTTSTRYSLSENLQWRHRENLRTNYFILYDKDRLGDFNSERKSINTRLTHILYKKLTTTIMGNASINDFTGGSENIYNGDVDLDYRQRISWAMLNVNIGHGYKMTERDTTEEFIQVIDESHILRFGEVTFLDNQHVDINSIRVSDNSGTVFYRKDSDYIITEIDSSVRISLNPFGEIAYGDEILVSYRYLLPAYDFSIFSQSYGINLNLWSAWRLYYRFSRLKENFLSGIPPDTLSGDTTNSAGTELKLGWTRTNFLHEDKKAAAGPSTKRWRVYETITFRPTRYLFSSLSGHYGETKFIDTGETERSYDLRSNIQWMLTRQSRLQIEGFYSRVSGLSNRTVDTGISSTYEWFYRIYGGNLSYGFLNEKDEISQETYKNHYVLFKIKRTMF